MQIKVTKATAGVLGAIFILGACTLFPAAMHLTQAGHIYYGVTILFAAPPAILLGILFLAAAVRE